MKNFIDTLDTINRIREWRGYVNKERFVSYAQIKYTFTEREAESVWNVWDSIAESHYYKLELVSESVIHAALEIARAAYEAVCRGGHTHWRSVEPKTPRWRVYFRRGKQGELQHVDLNLREKESVIKYAELIQQEDVEIVNRLDYFDSLEYGSGTERKEIAIYDGDIIFCTDNSRYSFKDVSGAYVCIDGCYKRLMYTPGRGYLRKGEPDYETDAYDEEVRYSDHVFSSYDKQFRVVGNIFVDNSVLNEVNKKECEE